MELLKYVFNVFNRYMDDRIRYLTLGYIGKLCYLIIVLPLSIFATCGFVYLGLLLWDNILILDFATNTISGIVKLIIMFVMFVLGVALIFSTGAGLLQQALISFKTGKDRGRTTEVIRITRTEKNGDKENTIVTEMSPKNTSKGLDYLYTLGCISLFILFLYLLVDVFRI